MQSDWQSKEEEDVTMECAEQEQGQTVLAGESQLYALFYRLLWPW